MGDVGFLTCEEIVEANDIVTFTDEPFAEMGAEKTGAAGDQNAFDFHARR